MTRHIRLTRHIRHGLLALAIGIMTARPLLAMADPLPSAPAAHSVPTSMIRPQPSEEAPDAPRLVQPQVIPDSGVLPNADHHIVHTTTIPVDASRYSTLPVTRQPSIDIQPSPDPHVVHTTREPSRSPQQ
jgi:hypothetical protein